jgi:hypothetical protein
MEETLRTGGNLKSPTEALGIGKTTAEPSQFKAQLPADDILNILRTTPSGLTAKEVADRLGSTPSNIGSRLSKLAAYGVIKRTRGRVVPHASPCAIYSFL